MERTKKDLLKDLEEKERDIENLHAELDKLNKNQQLQDSAVELKRLFDSYVSAGFTTLEALHLVSTILSSAVKNCK